MKGLEIVRVRHRELSGMKKYSIHWFIGYADVYNSHKHQTSALQFFIFLPVNFTLILKIKYVALLSNSTTLEHLSMQSRWWR